MAVDAPPGTRATALPASAGRPRGDRPIRIQSIHVNDVILFAGAALASFCLAWLLYVALTPQATVEGFAVWWFVVFLVLYWIAVRRTEGALIAKDRLWTVLITTGATVVVVPLVLVIAFTLYKGIGTITPHFFWETDNFCGQLSPPTCGGVGHAIVGSVEEIGIAVLIAVPLGVLCAVFLNEIGGPLKRPVRLIVDAMSGVPSIVAGLFIYAIWVVGLNRGFSGIGASMALSILMLPTITRTSEEVLRLVPGGLREGALALGASEWRTTWGVVLPTARSGLITAAILGVARGVGETAPLILTSFGASVMNVDPFSGPQEALPHYIYQYIRYNPGTGPYQRAWSAAVVLIVLVLGLFTLARVLGARTSIEGRQRRAMKRTSKRRDAAALTEEVNLKGIRT